MLIDLVTLIILQVDMPASLIIYDETIRGSQHCPTLYLCITTFSTQVVMAENHGSVFATVATGFYAISTKQVPA